MLIKPNGEPKNTWSRAFFKVDGKKIPSDALDNQLGGAGLYVAHELQKLGAPIRVSSYRMHGLTHEWAEYLGEIEMKKIGVWDRAEKKLDTYIVVEWRDGWELNADKESIVSDTAIK